ncbi:hypothetical protein BN135_1833 [Cronobacter muytjensii 530]
MNRDSVCRKIADEIRRLKEKEKSLAFLPPARHHISLFRP